MRRALSATVYPTVTDSLHIQNARIWTADPARPWARSITIAGGRIAAVDGPAPAGARVLDAKGRIITPGLIDSHMHLLRGGRTLSQLDLSSIRSRDEFQCAIAERHQQLPPHEWLIAWGWSQENWPGHDMPTLEWIEGTDERPVVCYRMDMHAAVVNKAVLRLIARQGDLHHDPPGGHIGRDRVSGAPNGLMIEAAAWELVNPLVPPPSDTQQRDDFRRAVHHCHVHGLTAVGSMEYARDVRQVFEPSRDQLTLRCRITLLDRDWPLDVSFARKFINDDSLAVIGCKAFIDGTLGSRTARMLHEYLDDPGNRGMLVELAADGHLLEWARQVAGAGLSPSMHAIGDEAVRLALDVLDEIDPRTRPRIEHAQQIDLNDIPRFRSRIASMQPLHKADDCRYVSRRLRADRLRGTFPFQSLKHAGAILAFGSDWPVVSCDPLLGIRTAVTGLTFDEQIFGAEQNLGVEEAMFAYTRDAAFSLGMDEAGVLAPGKLADLVMFDRDPFSADWVHAQPRVLMTVAGGSIVYDATHAKAQA